MTKSINLKTPIRYYGGKQSMLSYILPLIPEHHTYIEPFFGGGAVFFAKQPSKAEVVNDHNGRLITFYKALKYDFEALKSKIDETFHSRAQHKEAGENYEAEKDEIKDAIEMAWSIWVQTNMSYEASIGCGFSYDRFGRCALRIFNSKQRLTEAYQERLRKVTIESYDVLKVIKAYDAEDAFFYLDPPYVSANQGHYSGYTEDAFKALLEACQNMKGKFILSSYPEKLLLEYREKNGWKSKDITKTLAVSGGKLPNRTKVECLTWNY